LPEDPDVGRDKGFGAAYEEPYPVAFCGLLPLGGERRKSKTDSENDRESDQPHGHLVEDGWPESS
jgi:hypothetical protein